MTASPRVDPNQLEALAPMKIATLWAMRTPYGIEDVLAEGFLAPACEHGLRRNDIVLAVCRCDAEQPQHALFIVTRSNEDDRAPAVALWLGPESGARPNAKPRRESRTGAVK